MERRNESCTACWEADEGNRLLRDGASLITYIARARVPMPKSTQCFVERCNDYLKCRVPAIQLGGVELKSL